MADRRKQFEHELQLIHDDAMRGFAERIIGELPEYFFHVAASSSGKYHPEFALGEGGLLRHVKMCVEIARSLADLSMFGDNFTSHELDVAISALILHDGVKRGKKDDCGHTKDSHPTDMAEFVKDVWERWPFDGEKIPRDTVDEICGCIASHMGQWTKNRDEPSKPLPLPRTKLQKFVHLCDYVASRKYVYMKKENDCE